MMWKWLVCSKNKNMKTLRAGAFWENSHWFLIIMISIKWIFIIRIFTAVLLPEPKTESSCLSSSKHTACHGKMVSGRWLHEGAWDYLCFADGDLRTGAPQLAQSHCQAALVAQPSFHLGPGKAGTFQHEDGHVAPITVPAPPFHFLDCIQ